MTIYQVIFWYYKTFLSNNNYENHSKFSIFARWTNPPICVEGLSIGNDGNKVTTIETHFAKAFASLYASLIRTLISSSVGQIFRFEFKSLTFPSK